VTVTAARSAVKGADPLFAAYALIVVLSLHRGEVLGLKWEDVDLDAGESHVGWQLQRIGGHRLRRETKTAASKAVLPLPPICVTALWEWRTQQHEWCGGAGRAWPDLGFVISTRHGMPVDRPVTSTKSRSGVVRPTYASISVHTTRKTSGSLLVALDAHARVAMQILRHSQIAVTMNVYSEPSSEATREALRRLSAIRR
jgi:integrase